MNDIVDFMPEWKKLNIEFKRNRARGKTKGTIVNKYHCNMTRIELQETYNLIYSNWGFNYLNDHEIYQFLQKAKGCLATWRGKPGMIITKETIGEK